MHCQLCLQEIRTSWCHQPRAASRQAAETLEQVRLRKECEQRPGERHWQPDVAGLCWRRKSQCEEEEKEKGSEQGRGSGSTSGRSARGGGERLQRGGGGCIRRGASKGRTKSLILRSMSPVLYLRQRCTENWMTCTCMSQSQTLREEKHANHLHLFQCLWNFLLKL